MLRLVIAPSNRKLLEALKTRGLFDHEKNPVCFNFDFNLLAIEEKKQVVDMTTDVPDSQPEEIIPTLLRAQFAGTRMGAENFVASEKIFCNLEFDVPLQQDKLAALKNSSLLLVPIFKDDEKAANTLAYDTGVVVPSST